MSLEGLPAVIALFGFLAIPLSLATLVIGGVSRFAHRKKQLIQSVIVAEYQPPGHLSPAEIGYLFDSRLSKTEMIATLVDLEQKGLLSLSYSNFDGIRVNKKETKPPSDLKEHEHYVLDNLTNNSNLSIFSLTAIVGFKNSIKKSLSKQGYIKSKNEAISYYTLRTLVAYFLITIPIFLWLLSGSNGSFVTAIFSFIFIFIFSFPFFFGLALVAGFIYNKVVGQPGLWTSKLKALWPQLEGYREFVQRVELDNLQFESEDLKMLSKNKTMPYAIALGLNTDWQKRFS